MKCVITVKLWNEFEGNVQLFLIKAKIFFVEIEKIGRYIDIKIVSYLPKKD